MRAWAPSAHVRPVRLTSDVSCSGIAGGDLAAPVIHSDYEDVIEQTMKFNAVALQQCWRDGAPISPMSLLSQEPNQQDFHRCAFDQC